MKTFEIDTSDNLRVIANDICKSIDLLSEEMSKRTGKEVSKEKIWYAVWRIMRHLD